MTHIIKLFKIYHSSAVITARIGQQCNLKTNKLRLNAIRSQTLSHVNMVNVTTYKNNAAFHSDAPASQQYAFLSTYFKKYQFLLM